MDTVINRLTDIGHERRLRQVLIGNAVLVGDNQIPALWADYRRCAQVLERTSGGVQRLIGQLDDWLRGRGARESRDDTSDDFFGDSDP